jgi:hypothetical protein
MHKLHYVRNDTEPALSPLSPSARRENRTSPDVGNIHEPPCKHNTNATRCKNNNVIAQLLFECYDRNGTLYVTLYRGDHHARGCERTKRKTFYR